MKKLTNGIFAYLNDWKTILLYSIMSLTILALAVFVPVSPVVRILFLAAVVAFDIARMRLAKNAAVHIPVEIPADRTKE